MIKHNFSYLIGAALTFLFCSLWAVNTVTPWNYVFMAIGGGLFLRYVIGFSDHMDLISALKGTGSYIIRYKHLPDSKLFVGRGFLWTPRHSAIVNRLMQDTKLLEEGEALGGLAFIHGVGIKNEKDISIPLSDLVGHTVIIGTTRVGKTRSYEVFVTQAIKRKNETTIIFDPKGDEDLLNRTYEACLKFGREKDFMFFALPYPKFSTHYNPLRNFTIPNEIPDRIAMLLPSGGDSEPFKAFAWQVISVITNAMLFLNIRPNIRLLSTYSLAKTEELTRKCIIESFRRHGKYEDVKHLIEDPDSKIDDFMRQYHRTPDVHNSATDDLLVLAKHPKEHFQKMIASLTPTLNKLAIGEVGTLLSERSTDGTEIDWERAVKNHKVVYMLFGSLSMRDTAKAVIRMVVQDFTSFVGAKYSYMTNKSHVNLIIDEFSEVVDVSFINLLNKAGGAGIRIFLASQSVADLESELKTHAKAQQIFDNLNNKIWLRVTDMATAKIFADAAGNVSVRQENTGFSVSPDLNADSSSVFKSSYSFGMSEKSTPLVDPSWLLKLPKGQGFMLSGGRVFKIRIPLMEECKVNYYAMRGIKKEEALRDE